MACSKECYSKYIKRIEKSRETLPGKHDVKLSGNDINSGNQKVHKKRVKGIVED